MGLGQEVSRRVPRPIGGDASSSGVWERENGINRVSYGGHNPKGESGRVQSESTNRAWGSSSRDRRKTMSV